MISLLEYVRRKRGKIFVILDNASAHRSKAVAEYVRKMGGMVVLWFLPPRTPQHNPIEVLWREIKRAIADIYFGGIDQMRAAIIRMLRRGEVAIVSLFPVHAGGHGLPRSRGKGLHRIECPALLDCRRTDPRISVQMAALRRSLRSDGCPNTSIQPDALPL